MNLSKNAKILLTIPVLASLSTTMAFASPTSINKPNTIIQQSQDEAELLASTYTSSWTAGTFESVSITKNTTIYNDSYLEKKIKQDSFSAQFTLYSATDKLVSPYPKNVRTLYGSASATSASTSGGKTYVTYAYVSSNGTYEATVKLSYNIN